MKHIQLLFILIFLSVISDVYSQSRIYSDRALRRKFHHVIDNIYGLNFEKAEIQIREIESQLGEHPAVYLVKAFDIYWKKKPFKAGTADYNQFKGYLQKTLMLADNLIDDDDDNVEAKFFALSAHAYLAELYVENGENLDALGEAKSCYDFIIDGFDLVEEYPEYYFPCGIYNYYRVKYPEENPFFKPFLWFFRSGDKDEGLNMLRKGADKAIFTKVESLSYLFHIYMRYENQPEKALPYSRKLYRMYPANKTFVSYYVENLLNNAEYEAAKALIDTLAASRSHYERYSGQIFHGMFLQKYKGNTDAAIAMYKKADRTGNALDMRNDHLDSYLYCGLGSAYLDMGDKHKASQYLKMAHKKAEYSFMRKEAKHYLDQL